MPTLPQPDGVRTIASRIVNAIRAQIADGVYPPGSRLPSSRALAADLGVSRTTVTAAYEQLAAEGYLEVRQGARPQVPKGLRLAGLRPDGLKRGDLKTVSPDTGAPPPRLSQFGRRLAGLPMPDPPGTGAPIIDFRYGELAASDFPVLPWKRAVDAAILCRPTRLRYGDPSGSPELRSALQAYLWRARGLRCDPDQIVVVNGSQQGLDLCVRLLLDPGEPAVVEDPCYAAARDILAATGARLIPRTVDREGMRTERLPPARLAYVTPSHQFPLGSVMSVSRRRDLLAWAQSCGATVIEDDYDGEYRFDVAPIPTLQTLDRALDGTLDGAGRVIYLGTVSKTLSPALRLGYLVVPRPLIQPFRAAKRLADRHTPALEQSALANLLASGAYERHVRRVRRRNGERRAALLAALRTRFGDGVRVDGAEAGLHVVAWLTRFPLKREAMIVAAARAAGVGVYPITPLYDPSSLSGRPDSDRPDHPGLVIGYAGLEEHEIAQGIERLGAALDSLAKSLA
ncbi:PLP-dependent aminotransferase family protein (plasmid) [Azospirillum sp. A29]|uniref:MocR-like pyridoxine biosynthesis transcription factor PdxR n=1 Tax=Azospirillum sp. A29 TaxID=3160606 RepID=UPI00366A940D